MNVGSRHWFFGFGAKEVFDGVIFSGSLSLSVGVVSMLVPSVGFGVVVGDFGLQTRCRGRCRYRGGFRVEMCGLWPVVCVGVVGVATVVGVTAAAAAVVLGKVVVVCCCSR